MTKNNIGAGLSQALIHQKTPMQATKAISIDVLKLTGGRIKKLSTKCYKKKVGTRNDLKSQFLLWSIYA